MECGQRRPCDPGGGPIDVQLSQELLEIYKLHAELAERVAQRRHASSRLYVSLLVALTVFVGALLRVGDDPSDHGAVLVAVSVVALLLALSWARSLRSYAQLSSGKFKALLALEEKLAWAFSQCEWRHLGEGKDPKRYTELTRIERSVPWAFVVLSVAVGGLGLHWCLAGP